MEKCCNFLKRSDPCLYTGHAFRRSLATLLTDADADVSLLKMHDGWKSTSVAEKYVGDSLSTMNKIARMIHGIGTKSNTANTVYDKSVGCAHVRAG